MLPTESEASTMAASLRKVPEATLAFWVIKIAATTLGETAGDTVSMSLGLGYLRATALFVAALLALMTAQILATRFVPWLYWATIVASTTAGTTLADFADRSLGIGYAGGSALLAACVVASLLVWRRVEGSVAVDTVTTRRVEIFYWVTITFSQTLGTAIGDWIADDTGLGYLGGAVVFANLLAVTAALYFWTTISRAWLFWVAFVVTRPLGATVGDFIDKPRAQGGLELSRPVASLALAAFMVVAIWIGRRISARRVGDPEAR